MFARKLAFFSICLFSLAHSTFAQSEARIRVVIPSVSAVEEDLQWLIELSPTPDLKKQWKKLKNDLLDAFTQGVDPKKPLSVDLVFRKDEMSYESRIPVKDLLGKQTGFLPSLAGMGYKNKAIGSDFYEIFEKGKKPSYLRYDKNYAWMATVKQAVPSTPPLATNDLQTLLDLKKDVVAEIRNDAAGLKARRENFQELRKQFEPCCKAWFQMKAPRQRQKFLATKSLVRPALQCELTQDAVVTEGTPLPLSEWHQPLPLNMLSA